MSCPQYLNWFKVISVVCISISIMTSCGPRDYVDISHEDKYKKILGSKYITKDEIAAIGVTFDSNYKKEVDYVLLVGKPGFGGPEVVFSEILKKGSKVKINGVFKSGHFFLKDIYYKVKIIDPSIYDKYIILVYTTGDIQGEDMGMDSLLFETL